MHFRDRGTTVHATDNIQETRENMQVLNLTYPTKPKFEMMEDVFHALNTDPNISYVVLRNFDSLPASVAIEEHFDLDLLVSDYFIAKRILDAESTTGNRYEDGKGRIQNRFRVGDTWVQTDLRYVGDDYYDKQWQQVILNTRELFNGLVYIPSKMHYKYSLLYHAIVQKPHISVTYKQKMRDFFGEHDLKQLRQQLATWLDEQGYDCVRPKDPSVFFHSI